jgi:hypothetical protein
MGYSYTGYFESYDPFWDRAFWKYIFVLWPRRSEITNKIIWFKKAYKGTRMIAGPGEPVFEYKWLTKEEFIILSLKGIIRSND